MITIEDVTLSFPDGTERVTALDHVHVRVPRGTVTGITGPSGSGKSSLLAVASTLIRPDSGRVIVDGTDATALSRAQTAELRRTSIGIVFQQSNLLPSLTAREQLVVMNHLGGDRGRRAAVDRRARELLIAVGLEGHENKRPGQLSGGQRQRVNIARALMNDPSVLIVDEPTSALDSERGAAIIDLIMTMTAERDTATLLVTHDQTHLPLFDDVRVMVDGVLAAAADPAATVDRSSAAASSEAVSRV